MSASVAHAAMLMTLMRELEGLMQAENALLREMRLSEIQSLQVEKCALADAYERELRKLRVEPTRIGELAPELRLELQMAMRDFQATAGDNARRLAAATTVLEGVVRSLGASLAASRGAGGYPRGGYGGGATVVSLALNREI
jgi:hypothetical protein